MRKKLNCLSFALTGTVALSLFAASVPVTAQEETSMAESANPSTSIADFDSAITIQKVEVSGNTLVDTDTILKELKTKKGSKFSRRAISYDLKSLHDLGYFDKDKLMAVPVPDGDNGVILKIEVVENNPVTGLIIDGNNSIERDKIEEFLTPLVGMPRSTKQIKKAIDKIEALYHDEGYLLASVTGLHFDPDGYLTISVDEGNIGKIEFQGNSKTKEQYLRRIMPRDLLEGNAYNEKNVIKYLQALQRSGFFKNIRRDFQPLEDDPTKHKLTFSVEEQRTQALSFGTGIGTANGLFGNVSYAEPNFRGRGENISINGNAGTGVLSALDGDTGGRFARRGDFTLGASYSDPFFLDKDNMGMQSSVNVGRFGSFMVDSALQRNIGVSSTLSYKINDKWSMLNTLGTDYTKLANVGDAARDTLISSLSQDGMSSTDARLTADRLRNEELQKGLYLDYKPSFVYRSIDSSGTGWKNTFFTGASLGMGGDIGSYGTLGLDLRRFDRLTEAGTFFRNAFHAEGLLGDVASFRKIRARGPYGVRGYRQFLDVGRGDMALSNTVELAIPIKLPKLPEEGTKLVAFSDLGAAFGGSNLNDLYDREMVTASIGLGLEMNIPVLGPIRLDYGIPLIRPDNKSFWSGRFMLSPGGRFEQQ